MTTAIKVGKVKDGYCLIDEHDSAMIIGNHDAQLLYNYMFEENISKWTTEIKEIAEDNGIVLTEEEIREANERIYDHISEMDFTDGIRAIVNDIATEREC